MSQTFDWLIQYGLVKELMQAFDWLIRDAGMVARGRFEQYNHC